MKYDAFTLDTNIFDGNKLKLESGLLGQLRQFQSGSVQFVLSEIVLREIKNHLLKSARRTEEALISSLEGASEQCLLPDNATTSANELNDLLRSPEEAVQVRFMQFLNDSGVVVVGSNETSIEVVVRHYFNSLPPFENSNVKKNEFPDAIALLSLDAWAKKHGKKLLAVSKDKDWQSYAETSTCIDVTENLAEAIATFQKESSAALDFVHNFASHLDAGSYPQITTLIADYIADDLSDLVTSADATSAFYFEYDYVIVEYEDYIFTKKDGRHDIDILQIGEQLIVARLGVEVSANVSTEFNFSVKDGIDKDMVNIGNCFANQEFRSNGSILLTITGDFTFGTPEAFEVSSVELIDVEDTVHFDDIEPDFDE